MNAVYTSLMVSEFNIVKTYSLFRTWSIMRLIRVEQFWTICKPFTGCEFVYFRCVGNVPILTRLLTLKFFLCNLTMHMAVTNKYHVYVTDGL